MARTNKHKDLSIGRGDKKNDDDFDLSKEPNQDDVVVEHVAVMVKGAGLESINGVYERKQQQEGTQNDGSYCYIKYGMYLGNQVVFTLFHCCVQDCTRHWYISIVPNNKRPGTNNDIDFYSAPYTPECEFPPKNGWKTQQLGQNPPPSITIMTETKTERKTNEENTHEPMTIVPEQPQQHVFDHQNNNDGHHHHQQDSTVVVVPNNNDNDDDDSNDDSNDNHVIWTNPIFEIKVAILGCVGVGKTTVLNALLQDKFGEVSMRRRTTSGIHLFKIVSSSQQQQHQQQHQQLAGLIVDTNHDTSHTGTTTVNHVLSLIENPRSAQSTLQEITADNNNKNVREMSDEIQEKTFHIQHRMKKNSTQPICNMRNDTALVLMDLPGFDKADTSLSHQQQQPQQYVMDNWNTLDCVIVVLTVEMGFHHIMDEQVELLEMVKSNLENSKDIPVIILCNKVDDPDNKEWMTLVQEMQAQVERIFQVGNRNESLKQELDAVRAGKSCCGDDDDGGDDGRGEFPIFLPISAGNAFAYRVIATRVATAAGCTTLEEFKKSRIDMELIDKLGRDEFGVFHWKTLTMEEKYTTAFHVVSNAQKCKERLEASNFDKLLNVLAYSIGGEETQRKVLEKQIEISLKLLSLQKGSPMANELCCMHSKLEVLKQDRTHLKEKFWELYNAAAKAVYADRLDDMDSSTWVDLMDELVAYSDFAHQVGWAKEEREMIATKMEELVRRQVSIVLDLERGWTIDKAGLGRYGCAYVWRGKHWYEVSCGTLGSTLPNIKSQEPGLPAPWHWERDGTGWRNVYTDRRHNGDANPVSGSNGDITWNTLTYHDWVTILSSMLLLSHNRHFYERFSNEKMQLEGRLQRHSFYVNGLATGKTTAEKVALNNIPIFTQGSDVDGTFVPSDPLTYNMVYQVINPKLLSDLSHWGHLIWKFCNYMDDEATRNMT